MADWIWLRFWVMSGVGQGVEIIEGEGAVLEVNWLQWGHCGVIIFCHEGDFLLKMLSL